MHGAGRHLSPGANRVHVPARTAEHNLADAIDDEIWPVDVDEVAVFGTISSTPFG